ncbi:hypothetical protein [Actinoplanes sp. CA-252034]|uniref:hypothetical protein n=1 Tax=Actinoplanes sp. CA-252034 TaxID=3239906 RepID=UPI003D98057E
MIEPPKLSLPRWRTRPASRRLSLAAVTVVGLGGIAAAAVACHRRSAAPPEPEPLPEPVPPVERPDPPRFHAILLAIAAAVVGVWSIAVIHNEKAVSECPSAYESLNRPESRGVWPDDYRYSSGNTITSTIYAEAADEGCR